MKIIKNKNKVEYTKLKSLIIINPENINNKVKEINYVDIGSTKEGTITDIKKIIGNENFPSRAKRKTIINDIIYSTVRPNLNGYAIIKKDNITVSTGFAVVRPLFVSDTFFIYNLLKSEKIKNKIMTFCEGGNYPAFKPNKINLLDVININVEERKKISILLSEKEQHIENIKTLISKLEKRNEYYAKKLLSGELRVRENEKGEIEFYENTEWKEVLINGYIHKDKIKIPKDWIIELASFYSNFIVGTALNSKKFNFEEKGIRYLRTGDVWDDASSKKEFAYYNEKDIEDKYIKKPEDYIISLKGYNIKVGEGTLGLVTNFENKIGIVCDNMYLVKAKKDYNFNEYTAYVFKSLYLQNLIVRTAVGSTARYATKMINKFEFIFPNNKNEMLLINGIFKKYSEEILKLKQIIEKETKEFEWLSDKLLSGEYVIED